MDLAQDITFVDHCKAANKLEGKLSNEDNQTLYNSIRVAVARYGLCYRNKHETKKNWWAAWKNLVEY